MTIQRCFYLPDQAHVTPRTSVTSPDSSRHSILSFHENNNKTLPEACYCTSKGPKIQTEISSEQMVDQCMKSGLKYSVLQPSTSRRTDELTTKITENNDPIPSTTKFPKKSRFQIFPEYLKHQISDVTTTSDSISLEKLADLVRLSKHHNRERIYLRARLQRSLISNALSARFSRSVQSIYQSLIDDYRIGEKKHFARLYNATQDMRDSCRKTRQYALLGPELGIRSHCSDIDELLPTFLQKIPARYCEVLLQFLNRIRTDPVYLASRFSSMSSSELTTLIDYHNGSGIIDSNSSSSMRSRGIYSKDSLCPSYSSHSHLAFNRFLSFQRHDPLSALIHTCFANSTSPHSPEYLRRLNIWAGVCARLITEQKPGSDKFICTILNIWSDLYEWPGRNEMECYLMKIISDGYFLLEKAEDQITNLSSVDFKRSDDYIALEEFYKGAVQGLFEVIDNPSAGVVPESLLELGNAILQNLDDKWHHSTKRFFVSKWLFSLFLLNVVVHPESHGMMTEFHITKQGRQKILKEVFIRAQRLVVDMLWNPTAITPHHIKTHVENIMLQFCSNRSTSLNPKLIPANSLSSLRKVTDSRPYLVLGPTDIITIANSLFPEKNSSAYFTQKDIKMSSLRSPNSSLSGISSRVPITPSSNSQYVFDNSSMLSIGSSLVTSDTSTSQEPLLDSCKSGMNYYEDDGSEVRVAIYEMQKILGIDRISGSCHPCSENWAVLFVSSDGHALSTQLPDDFDGDLDDEDITSSSYSEDDEQSSRTELDRGYYQLRDAILKLVNDYEIPQTLESGISMKNSLNKNLTENSTKTNHRISSPRNKHQSKDLNRASTDIICDKKSANMKENQNPDWDNNELQQDEPPCTLIKMLKAAEAYCQARSDFVNAQLYCATLKQVNQIYSPSLRLNGFEPLLNIFSRGPQDSIHHSITAIEFYYSWLSWLEQSQEWYEDLNNSIMRRLKAIRDKMWYVTDVRNSAAYEGTRNVAVALKSMISKNSSSMHNSNSKDHIILKSHTKDYLLKTESQVIDLMAAIEEYGGPNKLSDEQSNKTLRWLSQYGIENLCKGEEHIHRFCLEIESCINKLVGENLTDGPVLWSSELFSWDQKTLELGREKKQPLINRIGTFHYPEDIKIELDGPPHDMSSADITRPKLRDIRAAVTNNGNQQNEDFSSKSEKSRARTLKIKNLMDSQDIPGLATPVVTKNSLFTPRSPFQTRIESKNSNYDDFQKIKLSCYNDGGALNQPLLNQKKKEFLSELKQTLTSLLMSDLGNFVFFGGSETDVWFSGDISNECFRRKELADRKLRGITGKQRSLRRKFSKTLDGSHVKEYNRDHSHISGEMIGSDIKTNSMRSKLSEVDNSGDSLVMENHTTSNFTHSARQILFSKDTDSLDFPYKRTLKRMLEQFSFHPNPFVKLDILLQVEQLIVASLKPLAPRQHRIRQDSFSTIPLWSEMQFADAFGQGSIFSSAPLAKNLDEVIDNCRERRSQSIIQKATILPKYRATDTSLSNTSPATTDMIIATLQDVFRNPELRPKTLFRDLQFISSFVPAPILDKTERGKAFWDAALAALGLKQDVCRILIEIADEIVVNHTKICLSKSHTSAEVDITIPHINYSMRDALKMWTIAAKEGDPVAARELAIFYLTHPEIAEKVVAPLSKPQDIFKAQDAAKYEDLSKEKNNISNMCIAYHWMELSAIGGDDLAKKFMKQREDSDQIP